MRSLVRGPGALPELFVGSDRIGVDPLRVGGRDRQQLEEDDVDDGMHARDEGRYAAEHLEGANSVGGTPTVDDVRADALVDRGEVAVEELFGVVCLGREMRAFPQLQYGLLRSGPRGTRAGDEHATPGRHADVLLEGLRDGARKPGHVLAAKRGQRRHGSRVTRGVTPALFDLGRRQNNVIAFLGEWAVGSTGDEPAGAAPGADGLERHSRRALVADRHQEIGVAVGLKDEIERLHRVTAGLGGMERRPAAGVEHAAIGEPLLGRHAAEPVRLRRNRRSRLLAGHRGVYTIRPVDGFDFVHRESVRFRDLDGMGHVNNAVFMTYMESARLAFLRSLGLGHNPLEGLILARAEVDFRSPIELGQEVEIGVRPGRIGRKSFDLEHEVRADGTLAAEGKFVLVAYDYTTASSRELPAEWRRHLEGVPV